MTFAEARQKTSRRQHIIQSAASLFSEKGYFDVSMRDVLAAADIGTGTFYNYFSSKEELLKIILEEFSETIINSIKSYYLTEQDLVRRFVETKRITMEIFTSHPEFSKIYVSVSGTGKAVTDCIDAFENSLLTFYTKNIEYGIRNGAFFNVDSQAVAHAILATEKYLLYKWSYLKTISSDEMISMVVSFHETLALGLIKKQ
jgi:AcrR family transcriptional regulator